MLRSLLFAAFVLVGTAASAQVWFDLAPKVLYGYNGYLNSEIAGDREHDINITGNASFGGRLGINFGSSHGLQAEILYANHDQEITWTNPATNTQLGNLVSWKGTELGLFYRYLSSITYLEIGPKYNIVNDMTQQIGGTIVGVEDIGNLYEENYISGIFGFGGYFVGNESVALSLGLRLEYALTPIVSSAGMDLGAPLVAPANTDPGAPLVAYKTYDGGIGNTRPLAIQFVAEFSFGLGGYAKAGCGQRTFVFGQRFY